MLKRLDGADSVMAVDYALVERGRDVHHQAVVHRAVFKYLAFLCPVDADDGDFGVIDDRRGHDTAQSPQTGDGNGRTAEFLFAGVPISSPLRDFPQFMGALPQVQGFRVTDSSVSSTQF